MYDCIIWLLYSVAIINLTFASCVWYANKLARKRRLSALNYHRQLDKWMGLRK